MTNLLFHNMELLLRLVVAVILGGIIGLERGGAKHAAGLRTHTILCLGAAAVMVISECLVKQYGIKDEIMRMGAQVISGVGFLGAGNIIVNGGKVHGITTATGLWTTACVGIAVGAGYYLIAVFVVILMLSVMLGLRSMSQRLRTEEASYKLIMETENVLKLDVILNKVLKNKAELNNIEIEPIDSDNGVEITIEITVAQRASVEAIIAKLAGLGTIKEFALINE